MEASVQDFGLAVTRADTDLQFSIHRLTSLLEDCALRDRKAGEDTPDLGKLVRRIEALACALPEMQRMHESNQEKRRQVVSELSEVSLANYEAMLEIYGRLATAPDADWCKTAESIQAATTNATSTSTSGMPKGKTNEMQLNKENGAGKASRERAPAAVSRPRAILEDEFESLPVSIRGRCKLADVQKVYSFLLNQHEKNDSKGRSRPKPLTKRDLDAANLKVFGVTGESVIKSLRSLGLITVTKAGIQLISQDSDTTRRPRPK